MDKPKTVQFKCIEVEQPIGTFYVGSIDAHDVLDISYADVRRISDRDIERYVGIQRELNAGRVDELKAYVQTIDASFPTSVILAIKGENAEYNEKTGIMEITREENVAKIIDGQHRIAGLQDFEGTFQLSVTVFVDMDMEDQAMVFATINIKQTRVSKSLVYDLFEYAKTRSPQKTSHNIAKLLNTKEDSPFKGKIKILGKATEGAKQTLTQATFVERLLAYISDAPMKDRDLLKRKQKVDRASEANAKNLIFRNMFIDERDAEIARIIWNYFEAVSIRWKDAWASTETGDILNRTNGFRALMRFLKDAYNSLKQPDKVVTTDDFGGIFAKIKLHDADFTSINYLPGTSGEVALHRELLEKSGLKNA